MSDSTPTPTLPHSDRGGRQKTAHITINQDDSCIVIHKSTCWYVYWVKEDVGVVREKRWIANGRLMSDPIEHIANEWSDLLAQARRNPLYSANKNAEWAKSLVKQEPDGQLFAHQQTS